MRFALTAEQRDFRDAVDALLRDAGGVAAARAWASGDTKPGLDIWRGLADIGLQGLAVPEESGGSGFHPVELCAALERIGYHAAPGPYAESLAASVHLAGTGDTDHWLPRLADALVALDFARPLVFAAALTPDCDRDVSAAKVAASEAADQAARTALQLHGAIGYTDEYDVGLYLRKAMVLAGQYGSARMHRRRFMAATSESDDD